MSMNNLHADHDLCQAMLFPELPAISWCWEKTRGAQRSSCRISCGPVAVLVLGAGQESLSLGDVETGKDFWNVLLEWGTAVF